MNVLLLIDFLLLMISGIMYAAGLYRITALLFLILTILYIRVHWKKASAVTAYTYGKNKNLDIKNGPVMTASVLAFTILGSWLSSLLPNAVLGGSSYIMTFIMGVRFLVRPITKTTSRMDEIEPKKRIIRFLLSGIHIGLFCGFVGAGGVCCF